MELDEHGFLEELLALRREPWDGLPAGMEEFFAGEAGLDCCFQDLPSFAAYDGGGVAVPVTEHGFDCLSEVCGQFGGGSLSVSSTRSTVEDGEVGRLGHGEQRSVCKVEMGQAGEAAAAPMVFGMEGFGGGRERKKKVEGMPSKNLMAERRRRKRLNDRLSMLRSVVPKISKMDRTSILGDTIDYMKELLEKIKRLQEEVDSAGQEQQPNLLNISKDMNPNEMLVRNSPKFDVERRDADTRIEICCAAKPGLLLSTVSTLEALGLEIQQCVVSCFSDFGMQASCSEGQHQREAISADDIKHALFKNAGYGGRCL